jgi:hypothetical protein
LWILASYSLILDFAKEAYKNHGIKVAESWIGRTAINIGDLTGQELYNKLTRTMDKTCPYDSKNPCDKTNTLYSLDTAFIEQMAGEKPLYKRSK